MTFKIITFRTRRDLFENVIRNVIVSTHYVIIQQS